MIDEKYEDAKWFPRINNIDMNKIANDGYEGLAYFKGKGLNNFIHEIKAVKGVTEVLVEIK